MITTVAGAQVITAVKRSPASPEANEPLSSFHLCRGGLCHLQIAGEIWFTSLQSPTRIVAKNTGQLVPFIKNKAGLEYLAANCSHIQT